MLRNNENLSIFNIPFSSHSAIHGVSLTSSLRIDFGFFSRWNISYHRIADIFQNWFPSTFPCHNNGCTANKHNAHGRKQRSTVKMDQRMKYRAWNLTILSIMRTLHIPFPFQSVSDSLPKMFISAFFSRAVLEHKI